MIKVYSTPTCPYCVMAKRYFNENNIEFENIDVSSSQSAAEEMISKSGQLGVPVIDINGTIIIGFNKTKIMQALGLMS
ncbi:MAG: glutaredoxin-like protein [Candidatus Saganbacteria bacterium]|uniref:Glutaredoxin-like protein n=1 Tax=Candidatus Saganbacteria bacterium TaxID=2575572 RepID=A0A833NXA3_UNCSA|nr:MAG: glutaredoxin-like protein [Candidatus Saganbacteria bacterium]